jgi:hypothetical protein
MVSTVMGMTLQCPRVVGMAAQDRGCPPALRHDVVRAGSELVAVPLSRVPSSSFEGRDVEEVWEWAAQCQGMTPAFPHSTRTTPGMAAQFGLVEQHRDQTPRRCQRTSVAGFAFDPSTRIASEHSIRYGAAGREWPRARRSLMRGARSLERGGNSPEGAPSPRVRRRFRRLTLERGFSPEGC